MECNGCVVDNGKKQITYYLHSKLIDMVTGLALMKLYDYDGTL